MNKKEWKIWVDNKMKIMRKNVYAQLEPQFEKARKELMEMYDRFKSRTKKQKNNAGRKR